MKWFVLLITIAIWQCVHVIGRPIYPMNSLISSTAKEEINPQRLIFTEILQRFIALRKTIEKKQENATKDKSNDEEEKFTSQDTHIQKREINEPELTESENNKIPLHKNIQENITEHKKENKKKVKDLHMDFKTFYDRFITSNWPLWNYRGIFGVEG